MLDGGLGSLQTVQTEKGQIDEIHLAGLGAANSVASSKWERLGERTMVCHV